MPRSHPEGNHFSHDREDRRRWRSDNHLLVHAIRAYEGENDFLHDMAEDLRWYGSLTEAQTAASLRWLNLTDSQAPEAPAAEAAEDDAVTILNGDYTLNNGGEHLSYKIHTVQRGPLAGKRIIKIMQRGGLYSGFAFLTATGHVKVWRRFADDENRNERYIVWSHILLRILRDQATPTSVQGASGNHPLGGTADGEQWEVQVATRCRRCNRPLTNPSSIDFGLGPECAARENNRTTAAAQHAQVGVEATPIISFDDLSAPADVLDPWPGQPVTPEPVPIAETPEQATARRLLEQQAADRALPEDDRIRLLGRIGHITSGPQRERFNAIMQTIGWYRARRICNWCGRSDFETERGCTNHQNNYCRVRRATQAEQMREVDARRAAAVAARGPNLSELGTVISGSVWVQ